MNEKKLGIYIHIPFCSRKCNYCDFASYDNQFDKEDLYINNLVTEIDNFKNTEYIVDSIFIGGGTPSVLKVESILKIGKALSKFSFSDDLEFSAECNPCSTTKERLEAFKSIGVNRISFGLQTYDDELLKIIGRIHNVKTFESAYILARNIGFKNINVDIIFNLPSQTVESFKNTLECVVKLQPEHISAYGLIIEENTPFYDMIENGEILMPDEDLDREMYELCEAFLCAYGYDRYEISNYSKVGFECKHNIKYWQRGNYIGFGLNSHSMLDNIRFRNTDNFNDYVKESFYNKCCMIDKVNVSVKEQIEESIFLGLRLTKGINTEDLEKKYNFSMLDMYGDVISKFTTDGLLEFDGVTLKLTKNGINLSNYVMSEFLLDD